MLPSAGSRLRNWAVRRKEGDDNTMTGQAKYKQFIKIAEKRTQRVLEDLEALGNCSNPATYVYSDHHLRQIFNAIDEKLANVKKRLHPCTFPEYAAFFP